MNCRDEIKLADNLKLLLKNEKLSLHQLSVKTKINKSSLHNYAHGVVPQGLIALIKISDFFDTSLDELVLNKSRPKSSLSTLEDRYEITIKKI